jgi:hypothetical protein
VDVPSKRVEVPRGPVDEGARQEIPEGSQFIADGSDDYDDEDDDE